jgi:chemotaxis response regulator CheB
VEDDMQIEKDHLYVIPSNYNVSIKDGKLKLSEQEKGGMLHAIDHFLTSMACLSAERHRNSFVRHRF